MRDALLLGWWWWPGKFSGLLARDGTLSGLLTRIGAWLFPLPPRPMLLLFLLVVVSLVSIPLLVLVAGALSTLLLGNNERPTSKLGFCCGTKLEFFDFDNGTLAEELFGRSELAPSTGPPATPTPPPPPAAPAAATIPPPKFDPANGVDCDESDVVLVVSVVVVVVVAVVLVGVPVSEILRGACARSIQPTSHSRILTWFSLWDRPRLFLSSSPLNFFLRTL